MSSFSVEQLAIKYYEARAAVVAAIKMELITEATMRTVAEHISDQVRFSAQLRERLVLESAVKISDPRAAAILKEQHPDPDKETEDDLWAFGDQWFGYRDLPGYVRRLMEARPLVLPVDIPEDLHVFVHEARDCYASEHYNAVYSLTRTLLETAITDICLRLGLIPKNFYEGKYFKDYPPYERIVRVTRGNPRLRNLILPLYKRTSLLIHGGKTVTATHALTALGEAQACVHELYMMHKAALEARRS
jgi:hypothetical protein